MGRDGHLPLFETKTSKGRIFFGLYAVSTFVGICLICVYRLTHLPEEVEVGRWPWIGLFLSEVWYEKVLPGMDIFVCTANPIIEPPTMVINTVLSVMAYDYLPEKLSVYLSDDCGSCLTFYALLEASQFSKLWLPLCKKFKVKPRCPEAYLSSTPEPNDDDPQKAEEWSSIKVELAGIDSNGGPCYVGTECFHRRETLCGKIYEDNTQWRKEMGLKYGCPVEDVLTGLSIQCRGWKSICFKFSTLLQSLTQHERYYCPFTYGHKRIPLKLQISYCLSLLWAPNCLSTLYYFAIPSLRLLKGISLLPKISSLWILPFAYVISSSCAYC
ncbi:hypothetical protein AAG906_002137 [Vitis piasezkii]